MFQLALGASRRVGVRTLSKVAFPSLSRSYSLKKEPEYDPEPMLPPDYPILPRENFQKRNPWIYDDQQERRNFNEPLHEQDEVQTVWTPDVHDYPTTLAIRDLACALGFIGITCYIYSFYTPELRAVRRSFPFDGLNEEFGNHPDSRYKRPTCRVPDDDE